MKAKELEVGQKFFIPSNYRPNGEAQVFERLPDSRAEHEGVSWLVAETIGGEHPHEIHYINLESDVEIVT